MDWKNEYLNILDSTAFDDGDIERAQQIKLKNLPEKLYKYRGINDFSISNLESDTVWINSRAIIMTRMNFMKKQI